MIQQVRKYSISGGYVRTPELLRYYKECRGYEYRLTIVESGKVLRTYDPENRAGLFESFVKLDEKREDCGAILGFVNKYGLLGEPVRSKVVPFGSVPRTDSDDPEVRYISQQVALETVEAWKSEIRQMRYAYNLFSLIEEGNAKDIRERYIEWREASVCFRESEGRPHDSIISTKYIHERVPFDDLDRNNTLENAKLALPLIINDKLNGLVCAYVKQDKSHNGYTLSYSPNCLLGSLWLQFSFAVTGVKTYRACLVCGKSFEISSEGSTFARKYCSEACRYKYNNRAKAERNKARKIQ